MGVAVNQSAPDFVLPGADGTALQLSSLRGRKVVLFFYPRNNTRGCTAEACEEIADAVLFLVAPEASYVNGSVITVDGGWTAGYMRSF